MKGLSMKKIFLSTLVLSMVASPVTAASWTDSLAKLICKKNLKRSAVASAALLGCYNIYRYANTKGNAEPLSAGDLLSPNNDTSWSEHLAQWYDDVIIG